MRREPSIAQRHGGGERSECGRGCLAVLREHAGEVVADWEAALGGDLLDREVGVSEQIHRSIETQLVDVSHRRKAKFGDEQLRNRLRTDASETGQLGQHDFLFQVRLQVWPRIEDEELDQQPDQPKNGQLAFAESSNPGNLATSNFFHATDFQLIDCDLAMQSVPYPGQSREQDFV